MSRNRDVTLTFFLAELEDDPPALLEELDTWSAGRDSGTGCSVGVRMVVEAVVNTGPEDMSSFKNSQNTDRKINLTLSNSFCIGMTMYPSRPRSTDEKVSLDWHWLLEFFNDVTSQVFDFFNRSLVHYCKMANSSLPFHRFFRFHFFSHWIWRTRVLAVSAAVATWSIDGRGPVTCLSNFVSLALAKVVLRLAQCGITGRSYSLQSALSKGDAAQDWKVLPDGFLSTVKRFLKNGQVIINIWNFERNGTRLYPLRVTYQLLNLS